MGTKLMYCSSFFWSGRLKRQLSQSWERYRVGRNSKVWREQKQLSGHVFFFFSILTVSSVFLVSIPYYPHLSCPGLVSSLQFVFFSFLPSAARTGDNRRTQVCPFTQFPGVWLLRCHVSLWQSEFCPMPISVKGPCINTSRTSRRRSKKHRLFKTSIIPAQPYMHLGGVTISIWWKLNIHSTRNKDQFGQISLPLPIHVHVVYDR